MNALEIARQQQAARSAATPEVVRTSSNITLSSGQLSRFKGSMPIWTEDQQPNEAPAEVYTDAPCAIDMREVVVEGQVARPAGQVVLTEVSCFRQVKGGKYDASGALRTNPEYQAQGELTCAITGGTLVFCNEDGTVTPHPAYEDPKFADMTTRALEFYVKTPFGVSDEVMEKFRVLLLEQHKFGPVTFGEQAEQRESRRENLWHLQAPTTATNDRDRILDRQTNGIVLDSITILPARDPAKRQAGENGQARPEFEDFLHSWESNLRRVSLMLASDATAREAFRLSSAITGIETSGYPMRATVESVNWNVVRVGGTPQRPELIKEPVNFRFFNN